MHNMQTTYHATHVEVDLDIFSKFRVFGYCNSMRIHWYTFDILQFMEDMWILSDYLNVMLLKHDERKTYLIFDVGSIYYMLNCENVIKIIATILSQAILQILS